MQHHRVKFVEDCELPEGHDFVFVDTGEDQFVFFRASAMSPQVIAEAWAALRVLELEAGEPPPLRLQSAS